MNPALFSHAATIWSVKDTKASLKFYRDRLGFQVNFTWEDPNGYRLVIGQGLKQEQ